LTVLDAYAVIAALAGEPAAVEVESLLRDSTAPCRLSAVNEAEVVDVLIRHGTSEPDAVERLGWLVVGGLELIAVDDAIGAKAGILRARHYNASTSPVSLADCVALATSLQLGDQLATADPPLASMARTEGCRVVALPDTKGRRP